MYRVIIGMGILAATCLVIGCGGGSSDQTGSGTVAGDETSAAGGVTKAEFIKQADAVCSKIQKEREVAIVAWDKEYPGGAAEAEENIDDGLKKVIAPSMRHEIKELEALETPTEDQATMARMIANLKEGINVIATQGSDAIPNSGIPKYEQEAEAYGFKLCQNP